MESPFIPEREAQHARNDIQSVGLARIRRAAERRAFILDAVELFGSKWCPTPACASTEVEAVKLMGPSRIITDASGVERDLFLQPYRGRRPSCHATRSGGIGNYRDGGSLTAPDLVWLFDTARLGGR